MELIITIIMFASSGMTFAVGVNKFFVKKTALFKILITSAMGCFMLGDLYGLVNIFAKGCINKVFNVGQLTIVGGFLFLFSASYSQMDGLVDDKSRELLKYRLIGLLAPAAIAAVYLPVLFSDLTAGAKLTTLAVFFFPAQASFYSLKHLIIPDVSCGIIDSIRGYSLMSLLLELAAAVQLTANCLDCSLLWLAASLVIAVLYPCVLVTMDRGSRKWIS